LPGDDEALMNEAVEQLGRTLDDRHVGNLERLLFCDARERCQHIDAGRRTGLDVEDHLEGFFVERHERVKACQVEVVLDKVFRHFGKVCDRGHKGVDAASTTELDAHSCPGSEQNHEIHVNESVPDCVVVSEAGRRDERATWGGQAREDSP
jgi:hypothetical protein